MNTWLLVFLCIWLTAFVLLVRAKLPRTAFRSIQPINFSPLAPMDKADLFGVLLSANVSLLEGDNFNQTASGLSRARVRRLLAERFDVRSAEQLASVLQGRLSHLGELSSDEQIALDAWQCGIAVQTPHYVALCEIHRFLVAESLAATPLQMSTVSHPALAHDIEQTAYLVRLGLAAGLITEQAAQEAFSSLRLKARLHFFSWQNLSLSFLVGLALRSVFDAEDVGDWYTITETHATLMVSYPALCVHAESWGRSLITMAPHSVSSALSDTERSDRAWAHASA